MTPLRKLISVLVALWLRDNPYSSGETWMVDENGAAVNVIIQRVIPEYIVPDEVENVVMPIYEVA